MGFKSETERSSLEAIREKTPLPAPIFSVLRVQWSDCDRWVCSSRLGFQSLGGLFKGLGRADFPIWQFRDGSS